VNRAAYDCEEVMASFHDKPYVTKLGWAWVDANGRLKHAVWKGKASQFPALESGQVQIVCFKGAGPWRIAQRSRVVTALREIAPSPSPNLTPWIDRLEKECAEWRERIDEARRAQDSHPGNEEVCFHADLFINHADSILGSLGDGALDNWCLADGTRPTREDIDILCCNLTSTAFTAGKHWQAMHDEIANEGLRAVAAQQTRGAPKQSKPTFLRKTIARLRKARPAAQFKDFLEEIEGAESPSNPVFRIVVERADEKVLFGPSDTMSFSTLRTNYWSR
jgi:hypothetical protein